MRCHPPSSHFIGGKPFEDASGTILESRYTATGEVIARIHAATEATVDHAVQAAERRRSSGQPCRDATGAACCAALPTSCANATAKWPN